MARLEVDLAGSTGLVTDVLPTKMDKNVWTTLKNGSARDTSIGVREFFSKLEVFPKQPLDDDEALTLLADFRAQAYEVSDEWQFFFVPTTVDGLVLSVFSYIYGNSEIFIYCTQRRVYAQEESGTLYDITPAGIDFTTSLALGWTGIVFGGILILNNGLEEPHYWAPSGVDGIATDLVPLSSAPGDDPWPEGWSCRVLRGFKNALFAMNIRDDLGVNFPYLVKFSDFAAPGSLPLEWTASAENSAGDQDIADDFGEILDAYTYRDAILVWKERSVYGFRLVGGNDVYQRYTVSTETGVLARNCIVNTDGFQVAITKDDLVITDGTRLQSLANQKTRRGFFKDIDSTYFQRSFVFHNPANSEVWFFKPTTGNEFCDTALVFDYQNNTFVEKEMVGATGAINSFRVIQDGKVWNDMEASWEDTNIQWATPFLGETAERIMISIAEPVGENENQETLYKSTLLVRGQNLFDGPGDAFPFVAERLNIPIPRGDRVDWSQQKQTQWVVPKLEELEVGEDFQMRIYMGFQREQNERIKWIGPKLWTPGTERVFFHGSGRFLSIRFEVDPGQYFEMSGYDLEFKLVGKF